MILQAQPSINLNWLFALMLLFNGCGDPIKDELTEAQKRYPMLKPSHPSGIAEEILSGQLYVYEDRIKKGKKLSALIYQRHPIAISSQYVTHKIKVGPQTFK